MKNLLKFLWQEEKGQDLTEYALLLALIALGAITSMKTIASTINGILTNSASNDRNCSRSIVARRGLVPGVAEQIELPSWRSRLLCASVQPGWRGPPPTRQKP